MRGSPRSPIRSPPPRRDARGWAVAAALLLGLVGVPTFPVDAQPSAPAPEAPAARSAPTSATRALAEIRAGSHPTFGRIVIDLPPGATATATGEAGAVRVRIVGATLGGGGARAPRNVSAITVRGNEATFTLAQGARFTVTRLAARAGAVTGERLVIDVIAADAAANQTAPQPAPAADAQTPALPQPAAVAAATRLSAPAATAKPARRLAEYSGPPPRTGPLPVVPLPAAAVAAPVAIVAPAAEAAMVPPAPAPIAPAPVAPAAVAAPSVPPGAGAPTASPPAASPPTASPPVPRKLARLAARSPTTVAEAAPSAATRRAPSAVPMAAASATAAAEATATAGPSDVAPEQMAAPGASEQVRVPLQRLLAGSLPPVLRRQPAAPMIAGPSQAAPNIAAGGVRGRIVGTTPTPLFPRAVGPGMAVATAPPVATAAPSPAAEGASATSPSAKAQAAKAQAAEASAAKASPGEGTAPLADVRRDALAAPGAQMAETKPAMPQPAGEETAAAVPPMPAAPAPAPASTATAPSPTPGQPAPAGAAGAQAAAGQSGPVAIAARGDGATLVLPFGQTAGAAAFRRGDQAVVVFDERRPLDLSDLADDSAVAAAFGDARIQLLPAATVLRMSLPPSEGLKLARAAEGWALTRLPHAPPLAPIRGDIVEGTMRLLAASPNAVVSVPDPDTGGALLVGTQTKPGEAVPVTRRTPDFTLLETLQGVAVDPNSDSLSLRVAPADQFTGFLLAAEGAAAVPPKPQAKADPKAEGKTEAKAEGKPGEKKEGDKKEAAGEGKDGEGADKKTAKAEPPPPTESGRGVALDPLGPEAVAALEAARMTRRWDLPALPTEALLRRLQAATAGAAASPVQGRTAGRIAAVQAQLALGMGAEADALANLIVADDARAADSPDLIGLTAVAALLAGRIDETDGLADPRLDGTDEITLWRAARLATQRAGAPEAAAGFAATLPLLLAYPNALRERLEPLAAETMLLGGEPAAARRLLAARKDDPQLDYARALAAEADGHPSAALAILDRLAGSQDRLLHARASVQAVEVRLKTGALTDAQAADALDKLVYSWRGDKRELDVRLRVADLRDKAGNWRAALALLRESSAGALGQTWRDSLPDIHARMVAVFARALEGDAAKALPPLELVSLLEENPDLLPEGEAGRAVAARLADRLVALDLPDRALPVLEKLMNASPEGPARAEIGARLAAVRLDQHDAAGALEALSASAAGGLPAAVTEARTITFARATAARGALAPATAALAELGTPAAIEAAATLYEQAKDWPGAVNALSAYAKQTVPPEGPLAETPAGVLLRLASAAAQAGDEHLLAQLRDHDLSRMPAGKLADMFRLLTERPVQGVADLPRAARETALAGALPAELKALPAVTTKP